MKTLSVRRWKRPSFIAKQWSMMKAKQQMSSWSFHGFWTPGLVWCLNSLNHQNHQCSIWYHSSLLSMYVVLQIEQDFRLLFGEATANTFLERWPTTFRARVIKESHGLVPTTELLDLMRNAESTAEVENGMNSTFFTWYHCLCKCTIYCTFWLWCQLSI